MLVEGVVRAATGVYRKLPYRSGADRVQLYARPVKRPGSFCVMHTLGGRVKSPLNILPCTVSRMSLLRPGPMPLLPWHR